VRDAEWLDLITLSQLRRYLSRLPRTIYSFINEYGYLFDLIIAYHDKEISKHKPIFRNVLVN